MSKRRRPNNPILAKAAVDRFRATFKGRVTGTLGSMKVRARKAGLPCTLPREWLEDRMMAGICEVTGLPFDFTAKRSQAAYSPSVDRIDNSLGYTPENCRMVIAAFNIAKNKWPESTLFEWIDALNIRRSKE